MSELSAAQKLASIVEESEHDSLSTSGTFTDSSRASRGHGSYATAGSGARQTAVGQKRPLLSAGSAVSHHTVGNSYITLVVSYGCQ